jgi:MraZ protein
MTLDSKGRLTVPAQFKDPLMSLEQGRLVVCKNIERSLLLFPASVWAAFEAKLVEDESLSLLKRRYLGSAAEVSIDSASRINVPPELREWAGLERDVAFMGMGDRFELWDKAHLIAHETAISEKELRDQHSTLAQTARAA